MSGKKGDFLKIIKNLDDALVEPAVKAGNIASSILSFVHNSLCYPLQIYNIYAEEKIKAYKDSLEKKIKAKDKEELVLPSMQVLGPVMDGLRYNLDEEYIRDFFTNILINDMTKGNKDKVLPSFAFCVSQLSHDDALFILLLRNVMLLLVIMMYLVIF